MQDSRIDAVPKSLDWHTAPIEIRPFFHLRYSPLNRFVCCAAVAADARDVDPAAGVGVSQAAHVAENQPVVHDPAPSCRGGQRFLLTSSCITSLLFPHLCCTSVPLLDVPPKFAKLCKFALHASALCQCHASSGATPTDFLSALCKTPATFDAHSQVLVKDTKVWEAITPACLAREGVDPATNIR